LVDDKKVRADFSGGGPDDGDSMARRAAPRMATTDLAQTESPGRLKTDDITSSSAAGPLMTDDRTEKSGGRTPDDDDQPDWSEWYSIALRIVTQSPSRAYYYYYKTTPTVPLFWLGVVSQGNPGDVGRYP
jgi:hypothetical protein